jgi:TonB-linked SusC/RagA family outer membrane protein
MRKFLVLVTAVLLTFVSAIAQTRTITGRVTDDKGAGVEGASVQIKGTNTGTTADAQGNFRITAKTGDILTISAINFGARDVTVSSGNSLSVTLSSTQGLIDEVIVTAQGIRRKPKELGMSIGRVSNDELTNGKAPNMAAGLAGKVSGLVILNANQSVDPAVKITLRGYRSIGGNNDALLVIDGLPMPPGSQTMLNLLNPNDIESVTVLKGGQAATLYGSDGVNGALVIQTKKGQKGKLRVSFSSSYNFEKLNQMAQFQDKYGSGSHYATSFGAAGYKTNYLDRLKDNWRSYENQQFGDAYDGSIRPVGRTLEDGSVWMLPYAPVKGSREKIWNTGYTLNNQVSFSGGGDNGIFYMSLENNKTEGIVPGDKATRTGARFSSTSEYGKLKVGFNANYVQQKFDRSTFDFYNETINQAAHIPLHELRDWRTNKFASPNAYYNDYYSNPFFMLDNNRTNYQDANISGNVELTYKLTPWASLYNRFGAMNNSRTQKSSTGQFFYSDWAKNKAVVPAPWDQGDGAGITRTLTDVQGAVSDNANTENIVNNELQLQVNRDFGVFTTKAVFGFSVYDRKTKAVSVNSNSIVVPGVLNVSNRRGELGGGESNTEYRKYGYYADAIFGWKEMIFLHGTVRYDATSRFFKPTREPSQYSYIYPGVDVSVIMTDLVPGIKNKVLNYLKLRAAYNKNGNDNIGLYGLDLNFANAGGFPYGNTVGISVGNTLPDPTLRPEFIKSFETGGELQLFNNRINLDISYYTQRSEGQVLTVQIPQTTGYSGLTLNVGDAKNWGWEGDLKVQVLRNKKFNLDVSLRGSINDNKILNLYQGVSELVLAGYSYASAYAIAGTSYPRLKAISYVRDPATDRVVVNSTTGYPLTTGPLKDLGRTTPKYMLGAGTKMSYGGFTLATNWEYRGGNVQYSDLGRQMTFTGSGKWTENRAPHVFPNSSYLDAGGKYVENTSINVREAEYGLWADNYRLIAEAFVYKAWFIKMRDINLSYDFGKSVLSGLKIFSTGSIGLYGRNLITIIDKENYYTDPEFSFTTGNGVGVSNTGQTPPTRQYGINLSLTFK